MRTVNKEKIALIRRLPQKSIGSILLPDSFTMGASVESSKYRVAELVDGLDLAPGVHVVVAEVASQDLDLKETFGDDIHRTPAENVLAYIDDEGAHPLQNIVMVKPDEKEEKISGTMLLMPDCSKRPPQTGTILAVGPKVKDKELAPGVRCAWAMFSGLEVPLEKEGNVIFLREDPLPLHYPELLAILEDSNE